MTRKGKGKSELGRFPCAELEFGTNFEQYTHHEPSGLSAAGAGFVENCEIFSREFNLPATSLAIAAARLLDKRGGASQQQG